MTMQQRTPEWYAARVGRITGSRVGAILGVSPYQTADDVLRAMVREYHGAPSEFTGNVATEYGVVNEPTAIMAYEFETGLKVKEASFYTYKEWLGASPDGFVDEITLIECKCPYGLRNGGIFKTIDEQPHYYAQMQIQMYVTNAYFCDFVQWSPALPISIQRILYDHDWIEGNLPKLRAFYERYLTELHNSEHLEPKRKEVTSLQAAQLCDEYMDLKDAIDRAKERQSSIIEELALYSGGNNATIGSYNFTKVERKGSIAYAKVVKDHCRDVDLTEYTGKSSEYWVLK